VLTYVVLTEGALLLWKQVAHDMEESFRTNRKVAFERGGKQSREQQDRRREAFALTCQCIARDHLASPQELFSTAKFARDIVLEEHEKRSKSADAAVRAPAVCSNGLFECGMQR
jgi:ABC-type nickel/cobalt efflux system permease component RcnA